MWTTAEGHAGAQLETHQNTNRSGTRVTLAETTLGFVIWELGTGHGITNKNMARGFTNGSRPRRRDTEGIPVAGKGLGYTRDLEC